ncbi:von Willebrand factor type A domain protein [Selenomonas sp. FOBRC6]|uniref:vWA domain-containing protein n=1 Tax=Selenomonas sp. FOBRC6 TaxID=936572 RepID=UPI00027828E1|nr:vWA domain-containing protein [Selenomonas sp. FOBRC6]EJO22334.1 von Willebrand factor type A domain protein [Selenomonas sp. FOBRC6]
MWKKIQCAVIACLLCVTCAATASAAVRSDDVRRAEKPERIELVLVLDKSGSMQGLESDTIGGFNSMIEKQKALSTPVDVTAVLFNDTTDVLYTHKNIRTVRPLTDKEYEVGGTTALLDAVGNTILKVEREPSVKSRGTKVVFVIITDGLENASAEFSKTKVKQMISDKQEKAGWDFIYLGANIDAVEEADAIGVKKSNAVTYKNTRKGVRANYDAVSAFVAETAERGDADTSGEWRSYVEEDTTK